MELVDEGKVINHYRAPLTDEYGGVYRDGLMKLVALFTRNLDRHEAALKAQLPFRSDFASLSLRERCARWMQPPKRFVDG